MIDNKVKCGNHGERYSAFVCQHLNLHEKVGFYEPFISYPDTIYPDGGLNAWCHECDNVLTKEGEWNE